MTPEAKKPMPAGAEDLAALLVEQVRQYERNCRCPKCHGQTLQCIDCEFCVANLRKLLLGELIKPSAKPAAAFFSCVAERIGGTLTSMKNKSASRKLKAKVKTAKVRNKITAKVTHKKPSAKALIHGTAPKRIRPEKPVSIASGRRKGGDSERGLYVRFKNPAAKALVKAAADKTGVSMNSYIEAATLDWVKEGKELANPKDVAAAERVTASA